MKTHVYSWRVSSELKSSLERAARARNVSVSSVLEVAARDWLKNGTADTADDQLQQALHLAASGCLGAFAGRDPRRAETAREAIKARLGRRHEE